MGNLRMLFSSTKLPKFNTYADFRRIARRRVPTMVFDFVDGGADGELTLDANRRAFEQIVFEPRWMSDVSKIDLTTTVLGEQLSMPYLLAPAGLASVVHKDGELAVARAAAKANTIFCISTGSTYSLEEIAAAAPTAKLWFQLYLWKSEEVVSGLIQRAKATGCRALVLTIDVPAVGKRERDLTNGMSLPPRIRPSNILDAAWRVRWLSHFITGNEITFGNLRGIAAGDDASTVGEYTSRELVDPSVTWERLDWLRRQWDGPLVIKGVLSVNDALECVRRGADAVYVSNHGGRQLDSVSGAASALPAIVDAVNGRAEIFVDGGVRRGEDVVKARALGATAALSGRPWFFALAADGQDGVERMLDIMRADISRTLSLLGVPRFSDVNRSAIRPAAEPIQGGQR
jgi:isopentenyl diphosphate isomerase/L-lactate dehydrogenase-like FMN-dependent dehydrogenase